jgi:hypothetical protein
VVETGEHVSTSQNLEVKGMNEFWTKRRNGVTREEMPHNFHSPRMAVVQPTSIFRVQISDSPAG